MPVERKQQFTLLKKSWVSKFSMTWPCDPFAFCPEDLSWTKEAAFTRWQVTGRLEQVGSGTDWFTEWHCLGCRREHSSHCFHSSSIPFQVELTVHMSSQEISPRSVDIADPATHQSQSWNLGAPAWCSQSRTRHSEGRGAIRDSTWWARPAPRISDRWVPAWSPAAASLPAAPTSAGGTVAGCRCSQPPGSTNGVAFDSRTGDTVDTVLTSAAETYNSKKENENIIVVR